MEITNSLDKEESESQHSSQPLDQVNYGTQPDEMVRSFEDYDWEQGRMIRYRRNDKGGTRYRPTVSDMRKLNLITFK